MIQRVENVPPGMENLQADTRFYHGFHRGRLVAYLGIRAAGVEAAMHITYAVPWTRSVRESVAPMWEELRCECRRLGCTMMIAAHNYESAAKYEKWARFVKLVGFNPPTKVYCSVMEVG